MRLCQRGSAPGHDPRLDCSTGGGQSVLDTEHPLLELHAGGASDADHGHPPREPGDAQFEAVPIGIDLGPLELSLQLPDSGIDETLIPVSRRRWSSRPRSR